MENHLKLQRIIDNSSGRLLKMDADELNHKPYPDKWSKKEILGHLIDSAYNNHQRILRGVHQKELIFSGYDQNQWVQLNQYQKRSASEVINTWQITNFHFSQLIGGIPPNIRNKVSCEHNFDTICMNRVEPGTPSSLGYLVWDYIFHLEHHLSQIINGYHKIGASQFQRELK